MINFKGDNTMEKLRTEMLNKIDETIKMTNDVLEQVKSNKDAASRCIELKSELIGLRYRVEFVVDEQLEKVCSLINLDNANALLNQILTTEE